MSEDARDLALPADFVHEATGAVRIRVRCPSGDAAGVTARKELMHYRFGGAVLQRIAAGSIEPMSLREADFSAR